MLKRKDILFRCGFFIYSGYRGEHIEVKTLLIVENNKKERQELRKIIQESKVSIDSILECASGEEALHLLNNQKIDVIFTDIYTPGIDDLSLIMQASKLDHQPKIVVVSSADDFICVVKLLRLGVREYLLKPAQKSAVWEILERLNIEIEKTFEKKEAQSTIQGQYLKQLVMNMNSSLGELESIRVQIDSKLFQEEYIVCCLDNMGLDSYMWDDRGYVGNVGQCELFVLKKELLDQVRMQEWRRRFVGVSKAYRGVENFQIAYLESFRARVEAFYQEKPLIKAEKLGEAPSSSEDEVQNPDQELKVKIETLVNKLGTTKAEQAVKEVRKMLWENKREKNIACLQRCSEEFFAQIECVYSSVATADEYDIKNLKSPMSYANNSIYEFMLIKWLESFVEKIQIQSEAAKNGNKMEEAIEFIAKNYNKDFNMAVVSNEVSMNYSLFSLAFKQYTGMNFVNYLKDIRMRKAKEYLQNTNLRIGEISQNIGYDNEKHFMKTFKALYGVSPTEYRKNHRINN